jgi:hypothetical protein
MPPELLGIIRSPRHDLLTGKRIDPGYGRLMRAFLCKIIVLLLALDGLACACPTGDREESDSVHSGHEMPAQDCHGDACAGDCSDLSAGKTTRQAAVTAEFRFEPGGDAVILHTHQFPGRSWQSAVPAAILSQRSGKIPLPQTPVDRRDRLLV